MKVNKNIFSKSTLEIVRGSKQYVFDGDGVQYLDCVNGTSHVGHCHPQVIYKSWLWDIAQLGPTTPH